MSLERDPEQIALIAERVDTFPAQAGAPDGTLVPIPGGPDFKKKYAELLYDKGIRVHLDEAQLVPVPGDQPGMGMWNYTKWVKPDEVQEQKTGEVDPDEWVSVLSLLQKIKPDLAEQIANASEDEREEMKRELGRHVPDYLERAKEVNERMAAQMKTEHPKTPRKRAPAKKAPAKKTTRKKAQ